MNQNPLISVVIASYQHESFIVETIQSVLNQSFQDFEIIITDDGSSDNSVKKLKQ
jgi:alpha-1,3-rhamnosyltransferase